MSAFPRRANKSIDDIEASLDGVRAPFEERGDARRSGAYRLEFGPPHETSGTMLFFGTYLEVTPYTRLISTNEESDDGAVTTVTFAEKDGKTLLTLRERYPTKKAFDTSCVEMESGIPEQFGQLDELLATL